MAKRRISMRWKSLKRKSKRTKRRGTRKMAFRKKRRTKKKLLKVLSHRRPHKPFDRSMDRDHYIFEQTFDAHATWSTGDAGAAFIGSRSDGFLISMNALINAFGPYNNVAGGFLTTQYGVPITVNTAAGGLLWKEASVSGIISAVDNYCPDGLMGVFLRYQQLCVMRGSLSIQVSQDTQGAATPTGSTKWAVCAFASPPSLGNDFLKHTGNGHYIYGPAVNAVSINNAELQSFESLLTEHNCRSRFLTPFAGSRTVAKMHYPWKMSKYGPIGYWTSSAFFTSPPTTPGIPVNTQNPAFALQPRILVQFQNDGTQVGETFRLTMKMKWYCTAFERLPNNYVSSL